MKPKRSITKWTQHNIRLSSQSSFNWAVRKYKQNTTRLVWIWIFNRQRPCMGISSMPPVVIWTLLQFEVVRGFSFHHAKREAVPALLLQIMTVWMTQFKSEIILITCCGVFYMSLISYIDSVETFFLDEVQYTSSFSPAEIQSIFWPQISSLKYLAKLLYKAI